jgi:DnaK suppressor protein
MAKSSAQKKTAKPASKKPAPKPAAKKPAPKPVASKAPAKKPAAKPAAVATKKPSAKPAPAPAKAVKKPPVIAKAPVPVAKKAPAKKTNYKAPTLPAGYKPTEKEEYMSPLQLEFFRQKLLDWRRELIAESRDTLDHLHEEDWHQADIADRASLETEAGVELRTRNRYLKLISKIDSAIRRIEEGEYGYCEETGEPIGLKRLQARPVATLSIEAQERHEKMERQYTDEE